MQVAVIGLGYVGCVTAACLADAGNTVVGIDSVAMKVEAVNAGHTPIVEPGLDEMVAANHAAGRLSASTDFARIDDVDVVFVCVGTPSAETGALDLTYVRAVATHLGTRLQGRSKPLTVVLRSTVLPGTTRNEFIPLMESSSGLTEGTDFFVTFTPEFLRESSAIIDFQNPPLSVIGAEHPASAELPAELFSSLGVPVQVVSTGVAEGLKYASNAYHAVKVTFANEIARICQASDIDGREVMSLFVQDRDLNVSAKYLRPGFAFGGSCLPKDVKALQHHADELAETVPLLQSLNDSNDRHIMRIVDVVKGFGVTSVAQIGLSFKPSTDDLRESPYVKLAAALEAEGIAVKAYDPIVDVDRLMGANAAFVEATLPHLSEMLTDSVTDCLEGAEVILLGTNNAEVCEEVLAHEAVAVVDLSGMLPVRVENLLRSRDVRPGTRAYTGAAW
ncbi:nucleotide sugar dehydrogenase [Herbiconiux flava]|uniref:UDP-glucose 6-dehydrogenase n=1 Tax=Herbiconiux flava TaxID=881268 RepID=A0A852S955_9MICO|nr:nucleotide sugar dehydrogenase [Herbiconiux flava]NYD68902.1 GDP-mannose 6-dehydrogenase [Herbiconiux flava]GLK15647.1 GDP-mannose 6-dehydrogenase [Herbiconiux flava]